jgi:hypothetical protein
MSALQAALRASEVGTYAHRRAEVPVRKLSENLFRTDGNRHLRPASPGPLPRGDPGHDERGSELLPEAGGAARHQPGNRLALAHQDPRHAVRSFAPRAFRDRRGGRDLSAREPQGVSGMGPAPERSGMLARTSPPQMARLRCNRHEDDARAVPMAAPAPHCRGSQRCLAACQTRSTRRSMRPCHRFWPGMLSCARTGLRHRPRSAKHTGSNISWWGASRGRALPRRRITSRT